MAPNSRPASACSMVSALIAGGEGQQQCPVCGCQYDLGKQRKLVDTNCGHARCFKCMFAVEQCPLCQQVCMRQPSNNNGDRHHGGFEPGTTNHQSCISRESGFQSFNGSVSSVYSTTGKITKLLVLVQVILYEFDALCLQFSMSTDLHLIYVFFKFYQNPLMLKMCKSMQLPIAMTISCQFLI